MRVTLNKLIAYFVSDEVIVDLNLAFTAVDHVKGFDLLIDTSGKIQKRSKTAYRLISTSALDLNFYTSSGAFVLVLPHHVN